MANVYEWIKDSIVASLKELYPERHVFAEEMPQTQNDDQQEKILDYFFLDIIPAPSVTWGAHTTDHSVLVDIAAHLESESNHEYYGLAAALDKLFRPVFRFGDRAVTIDSAESRVVDRVLHYIFTVRFLHTEEPEETAQLMEELEITLVD